uniref:Retrovirus-related Pol polyprotein from transposon TNT 1-94 n=1 Tax=Arundo donax TaxID=35708 RepID=A0A0A8Y3H1_ARUDO
MRTLLFQAGLPSCFWAEALAAATYLLNRRPSKAIGSATPFFKLHVHPTYDHLRVFGCLCYPNLQRQPQINFSHVILLAFFWDTL